jgi:hypothetical protein
MFIEHILFWLFLHSKNELKTNNKTIYWKEAAASACISAGQ